MPVTNTLKYSELLQSIRQC